MTAPPTKEPSAAAMEIASEVVGCIDTETYIEELVVEDLALKIDALLAKARRDAYLRCASDMYRSGLLSDDQFTALAAKEPQ